jgi:tetratricopeptide (TPR) repeat protein
MNVVAQAESIALGLEAGFDWVRTAAEVDRLNRSNPPLALDLADRWLAHEQATGSPEGLARASRAHAHALRFAGRYDESEARYNSAEAQFYALGLDAEAARTQIGHVSVLRYKGRYQDAVDLALRSRTFFLAHGDDLQAAKLANNLGTVYRPMGRLRDAANAYREARDVFRRLGMKSDTADVEQNLGNVLVDLGQYEDAIRHLRSAERIRRQLGLQTEVALTLLNIGILSFRRGDYGRALQALTEAGQTYEALGVDRGARLVDLQMLPTCIALNLREESTAAAERAIEGLRRLSMRFELGQALLSAGGLAEASGDLELACARTTEARTIFGEQGNLIWESMARLQEARLLARMASGDASADDLAPLADVLESCRAAATSLEQAGALDRAAFGLMVEGALLARLGEQSAAHDCYERARDAAGRLNADHLLFQAHEAIGGLLETSDPSAAVESYRQAIDCLETVRARTVSPELKVSFLTDKADVYERIVGLLVREPTPQRVREAFRYVERSKSRTLLEDLLTSASTTGRSRRSRAARLAQKVRDLRLQLNEAYMAAYGGEAVPSGESVSRSAQGASIAGLEQALARAVRELDLAGRGEQGNGQRIDEIDLAETPLPPGQTLVEYYSVGWDLLAFIRRGANVELRQVAALDDVDTLVDKLDFQIGKCALGLEYVMANLDNLRRGIDRCLQSLYRQLIEPIEDALGDGDQLVIVPHGRLHGLPFHAFHDGTSYLVDRYAITVAPSAAVLQACRQAARPIGDRALVIGIDDPGLPCVPREVEAVAATWPAARIAQGPRATSRVLRRHGGTFDVLHLATHGVFRADNPAFSSIKLADAWLTVRDLAEIARGVQLVTLSACETGVSGITAGDEMVGLTRGLLSAGCSAVVASLWTVSDESTALLMERFYASLRVGLPPSAALREAMLVLRQQFDHPYFWAPFVTVGDGLTGGIASSASRNAA